MIIKMKTMYFLLVASIFALMACNDEISENIDDQNETDNNTEWLIPAAEVRDGGPGKDGIPALSNHQFIKVSEATFLSDDDLILGFADGVDVRAYPHSILDWHEIINDDTKNHSIAVIYCPLTGTGIGWDRMINGTQTTFGVSGLLYNSNIIPYDRSTGSNWSQLLLKSVNGKLKGEKAKTYNLVETTWKTWKEMYPNSTVVSSSTGFNRNYRKYPYGNYKTSTNLIFPVSNKNNEYHEKERVLCVIIEEKAIAFNFNNTSSQVEERTFMGKKLVVYKNINANLMVAFNSVLADGTELSFQSVENEFPVILADNEGNKWDVFGRAVDGPRTGQKLQTVPQMMGYWFSFAAFYLEISI